MRTSFLTCNRSLCSLCAYYTTFFGNYQQLLFFLSISFPFLYILHICFSAICILVIHLFTKISNKCMSTFHSDTCFCAYCIVSLCNLPITFETLPYNPGNVTHNDCADTLDSFVPQWLSSGRRFSKDLHIPLPDYASRFFLTPLS